MFDGLWGAEGGLYDQRLGARHRGMNPFGSMHDAGVPLAFGSDSPVTPFDPWAAVRAAVHHHDPAQRLTSRRALDAHTVRGWRAARRDDGGHPRGRRARPTSRCGTCPSGTTGPGRPAVPRPRPARCPSACSRSSTVPWPTTQEDC